LHIISRAMFSANSDEIVDIVEQGVGRYQTAVRPNLLDLLGFPAWLTRLFSFRRDGAGVFNEFDQTVDKLIESRARDEANDLGGQPRDLLARLVAARDAETGGAMTAKEVRDEVVTIFMAGHETTAQALTWTWYLLSLHPAVEAKLQAELRAVLDGRTPQHEDIAKLRYTRMVIEEAMRLYPPAPGLTGRVAREADEICGRPIKKGAELAILPWVLHRHRTLWDDPDRFDPERFSKAGSASRPRFAYLPFGGGPRVCIGAQLAMTEVSLLVATMAQRYRLRLVNGQDIVLSLRVTMRPRNGIRMRLERRG